jgi:hypothetical protein
VKSYLGCLLEVWALERGADLTHGILDVEATLPRPWARTQHASWARREGLGGWEGTN